MTRGRRTLLLLSMLLTTIALAASCSTRGSIQADAIAPLVKIVTERHDAYVKADASLSDVTKADFLRSGELLRMVVSTAQASGSSSPSPDGTK